MKKLRIHRNPHCENGAFPHRVNVEVPCVRAARCVTPGAGK